MWPMGTSLKEKSLLSCLPNNNNTLLRKPCASSTSAYGAPMTVLYLQCLIQDLYSSERKLKDTLIYSNMLCSVLTSGYRSLALSVVCRTIPK